MPIIEPVIRPPSEANSFLLQVTTGCSCNTCTFCGAYMGKPFRVKDYEEVKTDIDKYSLLYPDTRRVFLMDGDALVLSNTKLIPILKYLSKKFPNLKRVSSYANDYNILSKTDSQLKELYMHKLHLVYIGLESGSQFILDKCKKKSTASGMIDAVKRAQHAQIHSYIIVLIGLGGKEYSRKHIEETISALNKMQPRYLSFLTLMLIPGTPMYEQAIQGNFQELKQNEILREIYEMILDLKLTKTLFLTNHASNFLPLEGRLPDDKERFLSIIKNALDGKIALRPEALRGL